MKLGYMSKHMYTYLLVVCACITAVSIYPWAVREQYVAMFIAGGVIFLVCYMAMKTTTATYRYFGPVTGAPEEANYRSMVKNVNAGTEFKLLLLLCWCLVNVFYLAEPDATTFGYFAVVFVSSLLLYFAWGNLNVIEETTETIGMQYFHNKEEYSKHRPYKTADL